MFHFPTFPPHALYIQARVTGLIIQPGFPIRTSSDHSSVASSSRLIAGSYVLHRLLMPRHPPYALTNLTTETQFKKRCSRPLCSSQTTTRPTTPLPRHQPPQPHHNNSRTIR